MAHDLVKFNFHGNELDVVHDGDDVWISVRRVCEALDLAIAPQQQKLNSRAWSRVTYIMTDAERGGSGAENKVRREMFMVHLESLAMWLATIDADKVKTTVRPRIVDFQKECARVLRDHFFPRVVTPVPVAATPVHAELAHGPVIAHDPDLRNEIDRLARYAALAQGRSLQSVHGNVRKTFRAVSLYQISRLFAPQVRDVLDALAMRRVLLPPMKALALPEVDPRQLRLVWPPKPPASQKRLSVST